MTTVTIAIGRNIGADPMPAARWAGFRRDLAAIVRRLGAIHTDATGTGRDELGDLEDSAVVVGSVTPERLAELRGALSVLAVTYQQRSIALVTGQTDFVEAP